MFLIDSSAWIEYLRPSGSPMVKQRIRDILRMDAGACCGIVMVEILRGAKNEKDFASLNEALSSLEQLPLDEEAVARAARWAFELDRKGKILSTTDLVIAASAFGKAGIVHLDRDYEVLSSVADIEQEMLQR